MSPASAKEMGMDCAMVSVLSGLHGISQKMALWVFLGGQHCFGHPPVTVQV